MLVPASILLLASCSPQDDVVTSHLSPDLVAATVADSVATGQALEVKVHWRARNDCQEFQGFTFAPSSDTSFALVAVVLETQDPDRPCTPIDTILEGRFRITDPPAKRFQLEVFGASQRFPLGVQGGAAPAALERYRLQVTNAAGGAVVEGAIGRVIDLATQDTVVVLVTDSTGSAEIALPCAAAARPYKLWVTGASGRQAVLVFRDSPQRCGVPERIAVRL